MARYCCVVISVKRKVIAPAAEDPCAAENGDIGVIN